MVVDVQHQSRFVGELLQFQFPVPHARAVRAAGDRQFTYLLVALPSHAIEPAADRLCCELGRIAGDPDTDEAGDGGDIADIVRRDLAQERFRSI